MYTVYEEFHLHAHLHWSWVSLERFNTVHDVTVFDIPVLSVLYYRAVKKCTGMQNIHESNYLDKPNVQLNWQTMHVMLFSSKYEQL